jgi:hypothetical protein
VEPDVDGDGTPDIEEPGFVNPLPDAEVMELDPGGWNPCEQACPEGDPQDPSIGDLGPPAPAGDPLPITPEP